MSHNYLFFFILKIFGFCPNIFSLSKEDFNKLIINRFSELHNFNEDRQIKELFELIFLNNKDVYQELESKNIFIFPHNYWATQNENNDFLIPLYKDGKIIISYIRNIYSMYHTDGIPEALSWLVFSLPKDHELNIHNPLNEISPDSELYKVELYNWYINEFLKYSK